MKPLFASFAFSVAGLCLSPVRSATAQELPRPEPPFKGTVGTTFQYSEPATFPRPIKAPSLPSQCSLDSGLPANTNLSLEAPAGGPSFSWAGGSAGLRLSPLSTTDLVDSPAHLRLDDPPAADEGDDASADEPNNGQDPTRPLKRLDLRVMYQNLPDGNEQGIFTPRVDIPVVLNPQWQLAFRLDAPFFRSDVPSGDNPNGDYEFGFGDTLVQALAINNIDDRQAWAAGAQLIFPTASQDQFGGGKYQVVPTLGYRYSLPEITKGSFAALLLRYQVDYAGSDERDHVSRLQLAPLFNINLPDQWFATLYPSSDIMYDFRTHNWFVPFNAMIGKMIAPGVVGSVEVGVPMFGNLDVYDFKIEFRIGFFF